MKIKNEAEKLTWSTIWRRQLRRYLPTVRILHRQHFLAWRCFAWFIVTELLRICVFNYYLVEYLIMSVWHWLELWRTLGCFADISGIRFWLSNWFDLWTGKVHVVVKILSNESGALGELPGDDDPALNGCFRRFDDYDD